MGTAGATMPPRRGTQCAALFDDGKGPAWYRAQVIGSTPVGTRIRYVDHGNCATVKASQLRPLDPSYFALPPQARECVMAFMRVPSVDDEFGRDAAMCLNDLGWGKELLGRALGRNAEGRLVRETRGEEKKRFFFFHVILKGAKVQAVLLLEDYVL